MENKLLKNPFKSWIIYAPNEFKLEEICYDFGNLDPDYFVIQVEAAGMGPYDTGFMNGRLSLPKSGISFGVEGAGIVLKAGSNCDQGLLGQTVSFLVSMSDEKAVRSYSEYAVVHKKLVTPINGIDINLGPYIISSPLTSIVLFEKIIKGYSCIVQDTAASSLGKIITNLCVRHNIKIINIVRRPDSIESLKELGSSYTLDSSSCTFEDDFRATVMKEQPKLYLTYLGGDFPSRIFQYLPEQSVMCIAGNINSERLHGFSSSDFIFQNKSIIGFQIFNEVSHMNQDQLQSIFSDVVQSLKSGDKIYHTNVIAEYKLSDFTKAREEYEANMSKGKIVIKPS